ncbi:MAG: LytTR family DNA-binding domain-containing protein [Betaproteobacteria bacterium]
MSAQRRITAIIADDEPRLALYLKERLAAVWPGLEVARGVAQDVNVVFVTAYDQYAVDAFERAAADYLLKPVTDERLLQTIGRLQKRVASATPAPDLGAALATLRDLVPQLGAAAAGERLAWVRASAGSQVRLIPVDDVCYFQANDKYTSVYTRDGESLIRTPLRELLDQLDPNRFWQVHRGTIVNLTHVETTTRDLAGRITLTLKSRPETVAVSRAFAHRFRQM